MMAFSEVIVLTALPDSEDRHFYSISSDAVEDRLVLKSLAWRNRITYFIPNIDYNVTGANYDSYHRVAKATFGDVFYVADTDIRQSPTVINIYTKI